MLVGSLTAPATVSAQQLPPDVSMPRPIAARPRPLYDPTGVKVGNFFAYPRLDVTTAYDDNIFAVDRRPVGDFVSTISPSLNLNSRWSRHELDGTVVGKTVRYFSNADQDLDAVLARSHGRIDVDRDTAVNLSGSYRRDADRQGALETRVNRLRRAQFDEGGGQIGVTERFNRLIVTSNFLFDQIDYAARPDQGLSRSDSVGTVRTAYLFSPRFAGFVQSSYDLLDYRLSGSTRNSRIWTNLVGASFDINTIFFGEIGVGFLQETFVNPALPQLMTPAVSGKLDWNVTQLTSLILSAERATASTQIPGAFTRETTVGALEAQHELRANVLLKLGYRFEQNQYQGINLAVDTHTTAFDARYLLNQWLWLDASYTFIRQNSNSTAISAPSNQFNINPYTENVIALTLSGRF